MHSLRFAGLFGLASLGAHAQTATPFLIDRSADPLVITATRGLAPIAATLRDAVVITRDEIDAAGPITLAELLQRRAGVEFRATGGPGQPTGLFLRGAGAAQTLVLVDGLRVGSATAGTTAVEAIPLELIERIEVVKGPMSSLYGSEAIGGVVQVFTRGKPVPHLFATASYGSENDRRAAAGISTVDRGTSLVLSAGARKVDARSATNARVPFGVFDPDRDPHENVFANLRASQKLWQGEVLALEAFVSRSRTSFDGGDPSDRSDQTVSGARFTSSTAFATWWASRLYAGYGLDKQVSYGGFPSTFETRQEQAGWINELRTPAGSIVAGIEGVRQHVKPERDAAGEPQFTTTRRDTFSYFAAYNENFRGQQVEASVRRDDDDQFGKRTTGAASYGLPLAAGVQVSATLARGFRAPTFNDLYLQFPGYTPNPELRPERSTSREIALRSMPGAPVQWRVTGFDSRLEDLIVFSFAAGTPLNVNRARVRGVEARIDAVAWGLRWHGSLTAQRPRDEDTGARLPSRAERFGAAEVSKAAGPWRAALTVVASGARFDAPDANPGSRLGGYARVDASVRYAWAKHWSVEVAAVNLADKRYEGALGYDAPRRGVLATLRFEAF